MATVTNGTSTVPVEITAASLSRPLRREAIGLIGAAAPQVQAGTPALLSGQLTYLCGSLGDALALDALYAGLAPLVLAASPVETRRNLARDPRAASAYAQGVGRWTSASAGGTYTSPTGIAGPVPGLTTCKRVTLTSAAADTYGWYVIASVTTGSPTAGALLPVTPGQPVTFSAYVKWTTAGVAPITVVGRVRYSADGTTWQAGVATIDTLPIAAGGWRLVSFTVTPPAGAAWMAAGFYSTGPADRSAADTFDSTALVIGAGGSYFDGSYTAESDLPSWTGTVNDSASILTRPDQTDPALIGLDHIAVGTTQMVAERAIPGRPARWLYTVEIREVS